MAAPRWLGIGAQRSGTTWFVDLLTQHPAVGLGTNGRKEQQLLHKVADGRSELADYLALFPDDGISRGEWTPQYLRHASVPYAAAQALPGVPILVLLRDPISRFRSAMRWSADRPRKTWNYPVPTLIQTWTGCYADQLDLWASHVGRERIRVMVYEQVVRDPQPSVDAVWRDLGLDPVALSRQEQASSSSSISEWEWPDGLQGSLRTLYRPQVERLASDWGLDLSSWTTTA